MKYEDEGKKNPFVQFYRAKVTGDRNCEWDFYIYMHFCFLHAGVRLFQPLHSYSLGYGGAGGGGGEGVTGHSNKNLWDEKIKGQVRGCRGLPMVAEGSLVGSNFAIWRCIQLFNPPPPHTHTHLPTLGFDVYGCIKSNKSLLFMIIQFIFLIFYCTWHIGSRSYN